MSLVVHALGKLIFPLHGCFGFKLETYLWGLFSTSFRFELSFLVKTKDRSEEATWEFSNGFVVSRNTIIKAVPLHFYTIFCTL